MGRRCIEAAAYLRSLVAGRSVRYVEAEAAAKAAGAGIWAGSFAQPEAWRHQRRK